MTRICKTKSGDEQGDQDSEKDPGVDLDQAYQIVELMRGEAGAGEDEAETAAAGGRSTNG